MCVCECVCVFLCVCVCVSISLSLCMSVCVFACCPTPRSLFWGHGRFHVLNIACIAWLHVFLQACGTFCVCQRATSSCSSTPAVTSMTGVLRAQKREASLCVFEPQTYTHTHTRTHTHARTHTRTHAHTRWSPCRVMARRSWGTRQSGGGSDGGGGGGSGSAPTGARA